MVRTVQAMDAEYQPIDITLRADALVMRRYRAVFGRDMMQDMSKLRKSAKRVRKAEELFKAGEITEDDFEAEQFEVTDLRIFENCCYIMARHADKESVPENIDEWLEGLGMFSIQEILPTVFELWNMNEKTTSKPGKN